MHTQRHTLRTALQFTKGLGSLGKVPTDWKLANIILIYKKGTKEEPGKYTPVGFTSIPGKATVIILGAIEKNLKSKAIVRHSLPGFMEEKSYCSSLISLL